MRCISLTDHADERQLNFIWISKFLLNTKTKQIKAQVIYSNYAACLPVFVIHVTSAHFTKFVDHCGPRSTIPILASYRDRRKPVKGVEH